MTATRGRTSAEPRLFFIHVMKTGGTTFRRHMEEQLGADRVYPNAEDASDRFAAYTSVQRLQDVPAERWDRLDAVAAHLPYFASTVLDQPFVTAAILRDPVERTISHLRNSQRTDPKYHGMTLEQLYDHPFLFSLQIHNHQVRVFALDRADGADSINQPIEIDDDKLKLALDNIDRVDILGLHDRYDEFVDAVHHRFGWDRKRVENWYVGGPTEVPDRLLRRIRRDNAADIEFFECVRQRHG